MLNGIESSSHEMYWDNLLLHVRESYVIKLADHMLSCEKWDKTGIPCQHAMAALAFAGVDPFEYVFEWFKKATYLKAYQFVVNPVKGRLFWLASEKGPLLPQMVQRMPGRPAKKEKEGAIGM